MNDDQIKTRIDVALELLGKVPALALANHTELQEFVAEMPRLVSWSDARRASGLPDVYPTH